MAVTLTRQFVPDSWQAAPLLAAAVSACSGENERPSVRAESVGAAGAARTSARFPGSASGSSSTSSSAGSGTLMLPKAPLGNRGDEAQWPFFSDVQRPASGDLCLARGALEFGGRAQQARATNRQLCASAACGSTTFFSN